MSKSNLLIFNGEEFDVYYSLKLANQLGENLSQSLFGDGQYFVQSRISKANFITFLEFLKLNSKYPNINRNNYYDYLLVSKEFNNILSDYLLNPEFDKIQGLNPIHDQTIVLLGQKIESQNLKVFQFERMFFPQ